ncbi:MAG: molybdenum cofactor cytidylyltransferase [Planctomycetota bacterium]
MISAILLAAGTSSRLGRPKQLLPLGDSTIIERVVENLRNANVIEVIVVLGHESEKISSKLVPADFVKVIHNPEYEEGMGSSIRCGMRHAAAHSDGYLISLGDKPLVDTNIVNLLVEEFYMCDKKIVVPAYKGERGHPVVISRAYRDELANLRGDTGARDLLSVHADEVLEIPLQSDAVLVDIDTVEDYERLLGKLRNSDSASQK